MTTAQDKPTRLELSGAELLCELPRLKAAGATVFGMAAICNGRWRVYLSWPEPEQGELLPGVKPAFLAKPR